jgi:hypothetical protein
MPSINNTFFRGMTGCIVVKFMKLETARAWALKDLFEHFWTYKSVRHAGDFLDFWTWRALRSRIEPMRKVARTLRSHQELLLNWFRAKGEISCGAVEGLNNKIRVVTRRSYGFRTYEAMEIALYHTLGRFPEPNELTLLATLSCVVHDSERASREVTEIARYRIPKTESHRRKTQSSRFERPGSV